MKKNLILKLKKDYKINYKEIEDSYKSYLNKDFERAKVPYVSAINDYVEIFFDPYFKNSDLLKGFSSLDYSNMSQIKQLLQLHEQGKNKKFIARSLGISKNTVKAYLAKLAASPLDTQTLLTLDDPVLESKFHDQVSLKSCIHHQSRGWNVQVLS